MCHHHVIHSIHIFINVAAIGHINFTFLVLLSPQGWRIIAEMCRTHIYIYIYIYIGYAATYRQLRPS